MRLTFLGAAGEVTGSCYHLQTDRASIIIDCGMFQGDRDSDQKNRASLGFDPAVLDGIILSHAHLDHTGRLPRLMKEGFRAQIVATPPTPPLSSLILRDAAYLQREEIERAERHGARHKNGALDPLFDEDDVAALMGRFDTVPYGKPRRVAPGIEVIFHDAGHILGSASMEVTVNEAGKSRRLVFSGDIGERGSAILRDPARLTNADAVILESTYGDRDHKPLSETIAEFRRIINEAKSSGGKILIPSFAIGRTQTLIYELSRMHCEGALLNMPVYVDSPMAVEATRLYQSHREVFDEDALRMFEMGCNPLNFPLLKMSSTGEESRVINTLKGAAIIIAGAGMCNGGRILHHLTHHAGKPDTHIVIVGFQAQGTLGRRIVDGEKTVRIHGEPVTMNAKVHTLGGFSAHAGQTTLLDWVASLEPKRPRLFLTHGENKARRALTNSISEKWKWNAECPLYGETVSL